MKKSIKLGLLIPSITLGVGGGTVGGMAIAGYVFHVGPFAPAATKTDIKTILSQCSGWTTTSPTPIVDSSIFPTEGALVDHTIYQNPPSDNDVKSYLINQLQNSPSKDLVNEITLSSISSPYGNGYYHVAIGVKDSSRTYEGTVWAYFHWNPTHTSDLSADFTTTAITYTTTGSPLANNPTVSSFQLFHALQIQNSNLNIDAITFQYSLNSGSTWNDWDWSTNSAFGATATGFDSTYLSALWNSSSDLYTNIRITPTPNNNYYRGCSPISFTLNLYRPEITSETNWNDLKSQMQSITSAYDALPTHATILQSTFDDYFGNQDWYSGKLNGNNAGTNLYANTWEFVLNNSGYTSHTIPTAIFNIKSNPYYNTHQDATGSAASTSYQWDYGVKTKIELSAAIVNSSQQTISEMPNAFMFQLNDATVRDNVKMALIRINPDLANSVSWNQIVITLNNTNTNGGTVGLTPISGSVLYQGSLTITYTLRTS